MSKNNYLIFHIIFRATGRVTGCTARSAFGVAVMVLAGSVLSAFAPLAQARTEFATDFSADFPSEASVCVSRYLADARVLQKGQVRYAFWTLYDIALYTSGVSSPSESLAVVRRDVPVRMLSEPPKNVKQALQPLPKTPFPLALSLTYHRTIEGKKIADVSSQKLRELGMKDEMTLAAWHARMRDVFPDVVSGSRLVGVWLPNGSTVFCDHAREIDRIEDPDFARYFFAIWLEQKGVEVRFRSDLLEPS